MNSVHQKLAERFYRWELRGRGWQVFEYPVSLEPPFRPFPGHYLPVQPVVDDGVRPSLFGSLFRLIGLSSTSSDLESPPATDEEEEPVPDSFARDASLIALSVSLPPDFEAAKDRFAYFLRSLSSCREPIAFEIIGQPDRVSLQFSACSADAAKIATQLKSHFPEAICVETKGQLEEAWKALQDTGAAIVEFGLEKEFMVPLSTFKNFDTDPLLALFGALDEIENNELGVVQILFIQNQESWSESITHSVTFPDGTPFFINAPRLVDHAKKKTAAPLYSALIRIAVRSGQDHRLAHLATSLYGALSLLANPQGNCLVPLSNEAYPFDDHEADFLTRQTRRSGLILNLEELLPLVHLPSSPGEIPKLVSEFKKTKAAPALTKGHSFLLGENYHAGRTEKVSLTSDQRVRHMHIMGVSGTGKSTLLFNLIRQDIQNGEGLAVLDPHGDLIERILGIIPEHRINDVVLIDPSDEDYVVGFNILSKHSVPDSSLLASDLVSVFERLSTSWGDQMSSVLQNAFLAILESPHGGTLTDLQRFLVDSEFRNEWLASIPDPDIVFYWRKVFPQLSGNKSIGPILIRLDRFLGRRQLKSMVSIPSDKVDFGHIMDSGKIFLAKLSQGQIGYDNAYLLGSLFVSRFQQLAMGRQRQSTDKRRNFWLYLDEGHNFITPSMSEILSGARKYRLGLIFAHQELRQLQRDAEVASAILSHPYTRIVFRVGDDDAAALKSGFSSFETRDIQDLATFEALCRVERSSLDFNLRVLVPPHSENPAAMERRQQVKEASRTRYGTRREQPVQTYLPEPSIPATSPQKQASVQAEPPNPPFLSKLGNTEQSSPLPPEEELIAEHQAAKEKIAAIAEALGYEVILEKIIAEARRIDVALERGERTIACEISKTNTIPNEVGNIQKCLEAAYSHVAVICFERKKLAKIQKNAVQALPEEQLKRVGFYLLPEFLAKLREWVTEDGTKPKETKPKKQSIKFTTHLDSETQQKQAEEMLKILAKNKKPPKKLP